MPSYNRVLLMGHLTRDPEIRYTPGGMAVAAFGLAVNNRYKKDGEVKEEVSFFDVEAWGKTAENCAEYLSRGRPVFVDGRLKQDRWEDDNGNKRQKIKVVADRIVFLGKKDDAGEQPAAAGNGAPAEDQDVF